MSCEVRARSVSTVAVSAAVGDSSVAGARSNSASMDAGSLGFSEKPSPSASVATSSALMRSTRRSNCSRSRGSVRAPPGAVNSTSMARSNSTRAAIEVADLQLALAGKIVFLRLVDERLDGIGCWRDLCRRRLGNRGRRDRARTVLSGCRPTAGCHESKTCDRQRRQPGKLQHQALRESVRKNQARIAPTYRPCTWRHGPSKGATQL